MEPPKIEIGQTVTLTGIVKALDCSNGYWRYGIEVRYYDNVARDYTDKLVWVTQAQIVSLQGK